SASAHDVATAAHNAANGNTSDPHKLGPVSIAVATSPEKNPNDTSSAVTRPTTASESTRFFASASTCCACSTCPQLKNRFRPRIPPQRTPCPSSAPSGGSTSASTASVSLPRPCQVSALLSTIAAGRPPPRSNANLASSSPQAKFDMVIALAPASMLT